jgi:thiosulfate dehydrogenase [quinone] large subunit
MKGSEEMSRLRGYAVPLAAVAAIVLFYLQNPWVSPPDSITPVLTVAFWVLAILVVFLMFEDRKDPQAQVVEVEGPAFTRYLFGNTRAGLFWLPIRLFVGFQWIEAGWHKATGSGWIDGGGSALLGFWKNAVNVPAAGAAGKAPITFEWYRTFLQGLIDNHAQTWFAWLITFGEIAIGIGILAGALVGVAAFFGATMNMSFMLAGSASTNPVLFFFEIGLILAWRVAGYYGVDRYLLPRLGVPWHAKVTEKPASLAPQGLPAH